MDSFFKEQKNSISAYLANFLKQKQNDVTLVNKFGLEVLKKLEETTQNGKMIRGGLVGLAYRFNEKPIDETCLILASALELVHSALLIHDDIMDEDTLRRGKPTLHIYYQRIFKNKQSIEAQHGGESLAMCVGDVAMFLSFELIGKIITALKPEAAQACLQIFSEELVKVGLAQMQDVYMGLESEPFSSSDIINLYKYKTARYTFSLPLQLGSIAGNQKPTVSKDLEKLGESLGIIFQLKDDELGMMGQEDQIGKSVGSDIREGKKTLYHYFLFEKVNESEKQKLSSLFGNSSITKQDVDYVKNLITKYEIIEFIEKIIFNEKIKAEKIITNIELSSDHKATLKQLLAYNLNRKT